MIGLYAALIVAGLVLLARLLSPLAAWSVRVVEAKRRVRHARRRRARVRGYLPVYDQDYEPSWQGYADQGLPWTGEFEDEVNAGRVDVS